MKFKAQAGLWAIIPVLIAVLVAWLLLNSGRDWPVAAAQISTVRATLTRPVTTATVAPTVTVTPCRPTSYNFRDGTPEPAPQRTMVGTGFVWRGRVLTAKTCQPIANAAITIWLTNDSSHYDDERRALVLSAADGSFTFYSNFPGAYGGEPPHLHVIVTAKGFRRIEYRVFLEAAQTQLERNIILLPLK